ncbi:MAG TPA: tetratricopeptide repeat protein, partial [Candidatus Eisenbacteria bacterium]|nr:tetratricopeptide repeat protein [Candidatus Eisenbacteria bacterium]
KTAAAPAGQAAPVDHVQAGNEFLAKKLFDDAEREFRLALEQDPDDLGAVSGLGQVALARGQYREALPHLERATSISSEMVSAFRSLGDAHAATGDLTRASMAYRQAVALAPNDLDTRLKLARTLTENGEYTEAREVLNSTIRVSRGNHPANARSYAQLGEVYSKEGRTPEAMAALYKAAEVAPQDPEITRALAASAVRGGLYAEAASAYSRILSISPLDIEAKKQLAWVEFKLERYPVAIRHYEAVGESLGTVDRYYLAQAYAKTNKVDRAVDLFREVVRTDPENYKGVYCNMAYAYYDANRYQRAIEVAREGLTGDSASACLRFCWAQALDKLGRHEDAIPVFETVLGDPAYAEPAKRELERQRRIVRLLKTKERGTN